jgi:transposase-like protein
MSEESYPHTGFRLPRKMLQDVKALARAYDVDQTTVHRWAIKALLDYVKRHKGRVVLPLDFDEHWQKLSAKK